MTVVSNTSPLSYLVLIGQINVLPQLFSEITIPLAVRRELEAAGAPEPIKRWIAEPPAWLLVYPGRSPADARTAESDLDRLHAGERAVIALASHLKADLVLLDDKAARIAARSRSLQVTGLLGVLKEASRLGLLDLAESIERLQRTAFRASPALLKQVLEDF